MSVLLYACAQRRTSWLYNLGFQHILQRNLSKLVQCAHNESCRRLSSASINNQITTMKTSNRKFQKLHWNNFIFLKQNKIKSNQFLCKNEKIGMHSIICTKNVYESPFQLWYHSLWRTQEFPCCNSTGGFSATLPIPLNTRLNVKNTNSFIKHSLLNEFFIFQPVWLKIEIVNRYIYVTRNDSYWIIYLGFVRFDCGGIFL